MSSDDDDPGRKRNTDRDHKPAGAARDGHAPRGSVGRPAAGIDGPGLGRSSQGRIFDQAKSQDMVRDDAGKILFRKSEDRAYDPAKPYAIETGAQEQDKELAKDHNVITREEAEEMMGKEKVGQTFYDEPSQDADREQDEATSREEAEKARAKEIAEKFKADKGKEQGHER